MTKEIKEIFDNVSEMNTLPVVFAGSGVSKRYTINKYNWKELLIECISQYNNSPLNKYREYKVDIEHSLNTQEVNKFSINEGIGTLIEQDFNKAFYRGEISGLKVVGDNNPLKTFVANLLSHAELDNEMIKEINLLKDLKEKMLTVVTTNYDDFFEKNIFTKHDKVIGQKMFQSSEMGTLFKIHGCVTEPESIVLTSRDYELFKRKRKVLSAKLIGLFTENPVIFIGYSLEDENIKSILLDIFQCIEDKWEYEEFKKRLIIVDYNESQDTPIVGTHSMVINDITITLTKIITNSYLPVLRGMERLKKKVRFRDLIHIKDIIYDVVHSHEGKKSKFVNLLDEQAEEEIDKDEVIVAIAKKSELLDSVGITGVKADELFNDALTDSLDTKIKGREKLLIESQLPILFRSNTVLPIHKYFSKVDINDIEITESIRKKLDKDIETLLNRVIKKDICLYNENCFRSFEEIMNSDYGMYRKANFLVIKSIYHAEAEEIKEFLLGGGKEKLLEYSNGRTMVRKMICAYDILKYKNA